MATNTISREAETRRTLNPLYRDHRMKLGVMAFNCSHGSSITTAEGAWTMTWPETVELARMCDRAGMEVLLPVGRWRGYGGPSNFNNRTFESFTWAAGLGCVTEQIGVFATCHVPLVHPVMAAKMAATIDHQTNGRFCLNVVCGWFKDEFDMFGAEWRLHDERYVYGEEWVRFVRELWSREGEFDFDGTYFHAKRAWSEPKPIQKPFPPIMNAGGSQQGREFAATVADMNFVILTRHDFEGGKAQVESLKAMARAAGRKVEVWIHVYVVCRETQKEADDYLNYYVREKGDLTAVDNLLRIFGMQSATLDPQKLADFRFHFMAGHGGYPLVGTPERIVGELETLTKMGVDGCLISWVNYKDECQQWIDKVMPLMVQAGQRRP
jgi:alkanesulfonate monooxygenase SsuD/methylene tetrahydromethanopterin reductase-like flavin-dependent oxidoreductase (luciferase family)